MRDSLISFTCAKCQTSFRFDICGPGDEAICPNCLALLEIFPKDRPKNAEISAAAQISDVKIAARATFGDVY
ncbi:MAG: hypothetical protein HUK22_04870, partial [Thermoguttaceae bacterium]|nr:hypothetical protein [Thermoguttaceae bacterium]